MTTLPQGSGQATSGHAAHRTKSKHFIMAKCKIPAAGRRPAYLGPALLQVSPLTPWIIICSLEPTCTLMPKTPAPNPHSPPMKVPSSPLHTHRMCITSEAHGNTCCSGRAETTTLTLHAAAALENRLQFAWPDDAPAGQMSPRNESPCLCDNWDTKAHRSTPKYNSHKMETTQNATTW